MFMPGMVCLATGCAPKGVHPGLRFLTSAHVWDAHFLGTEADPNIHPSPEQNSKHCLLRLFVIYQYIYLLSASICKYNNRPDYPGANKDWPRLSRCQVRIGLDCPGARYDWLRLSRRQVRMGSRLSRCHLKIGLDYPSARNGLDYPEVRKGLT